MVENDGAAAVAAAAAAGNQVGPNNVVQYFVTTLAGELLDEAIIVLLHHWTFEGQIPDNVHAPGRSGHMNPTQIDTIKQAALASKNILVPTMFNTPQDRTAATNLVAQLPNEDVCIIAALLLEPGVEFTRALNEILLQKHDELLSLGFDDVIVSPDFDSPATVRRAVTNCRVSWELLTRRIQLQLEMEPEIDEQELRTLRQRHARILMDEIPRTLMPKFPVQDQNLRETANSVGEFKVLRRLHLQGGTFVLAEGKHGAGDCVMIKVIDKSTVKDTTAVEAIYREQRFLSDVLRHPNIAECINAMHSHHRVYLVFAYAGECSLSEFLTDMPGERLPPEDAIIHFDEIASALKYCHTNVVALRALSLDNVLMLRTNLDAGFHCKLLSFSAATFSHGDSLSQAAFGTLPCMAPEVALAREYNPFRADCWSIGVILLEMAGGLTSVARAIPVDMQDDAPMVAPHLVDFFSARGSHRRALAKIGGVQSVEIEDVLQRLVLPEPNDRAAMSEIVKGRAGMLGAASGDGAGD